MKFLLAIKNKLKKTPKSAILAAAVVAVALPVAVAFGWGPERPVYDFNKYNPNLSCTDPSQAFGRCGSMDGPVFNSFYNTNNYGEEREFNTVAEVVPNQSPVNADYADSKTVEPGKEYWVRTYVHNNANEATNGPEFDHRGIATNTRVKVEIAQGQANGVGILSKITADNAKPGAVWDDSSLVNNSQAFSVSYVPGSASIYNATQDQHWALGDDVVSGDGAKIGNNGNLNGDMGGCFHNILYVYVKVQVKAPALKFEKLVRQDGGTSEDWKSQIHAKKGDQVEYLLDYENTGSDVLNNIVLSDELPNNLELVPGSVRWIDINNPKPGAPVPDALLFNPAGVTVGNYGPHGGGYIFFEARVKTEVSDCVARNVAFAVGTNVPKQRGEAVVIIDNCQPNVPVALCDGLSATGLGNRKYRYDLSYTAKNATLKTVQYNFGDNTTPLVTDKTTVEHTYAKDGTYTTTTKLTFSVKGKDVVVTDAKCSVKVSTTTPVTPTTPTVLPNTGAGETVIGLFVATTVAGAAAHYVFTSRRFGRM